MKRKSIICMAVAFILAMSSFTAVFADNINQIIGSGNTVVFNDVPNDYWAKDQIDYFAQQGIVTGYEDGSFNPEGGVTREEFCKVLLTAFGQKGTPNAEPSFSDVAQDRWSFEYIEGCRNFLTGYSNPFGGLPAFHPTEYATREDIAVALVKLLGYSDTDANDKDYALKRFNDGSSISPSLLPYVSVACEKGFISGYPDGTFGPLKGITRAETIVLLNRVTKQAMADIDADLELSASISYSNYGQKATISIVAEEGTSVTVNGEKVKMTGNYSGEYIGSYGYEFTSEGSKDFTIVGTKAGKTKTVNLTAQYQVGAPTLTITNCPTSVSDKTVTISGTTYDKEYATTLKINGTTVSTNSSPGYTDSWSKTYTLTEGKNTFEFVLTNSAGKSVTETKTIKLTYDEPDLVITSCPSSVSSKEITITGTMYDKNYSTTLLINGETVATNSTADYKKSWSQTYTLKEGENTFNFVLKNSAGLTSGITKTVTYSAGAPELTITSCPSSVSDKSVTISGTIYDENYTTELLINGISVATNSTPDYSKSWSQTYTLKEGENTFEFVLTNSAGKSTTQTKTITFNVGSPEIQFINCPESTTKENITIKGKITGTNDGAMLFIDDEEVHISSSGEFSVTYQLEEGANTFVFRAVNDYGKEVTVTKTITYAQKTSEVIEPDPESEVILEGKITKKIDVSE